MNSVTNNGSGDFTERLNKFLTRESKTLGDLQTFCNPRHTTGSSPESIICAVGGVLEKTAKHPSDGNAYRRLRTFSAIVPTPSGGENMETWMEQARLLISESECSEKEKQRRIVESLKGPALEIIRAVRFSDPEASAWHYLEALETTFGSSESGEDLYFKLRLMRQSSGETLSEFLRRIEKMLNKVVERDGAPLELVDKVQIEQLIRGAVNSDMVLLQLWLRERTTRPPSFLSLLKEIREAEESETSRHRVSAKVKAIHCCEEERESAFAIQELRGEIKELRAQICGGESKTVSTSSLVIQPKEKQKEKIDNTEVQELRKQIQQLQQQLAVMSVSSAQLALPSPEPQTNSSVSSKGLRSKSAREKEEYFCYRCGEDGHIATKCQAIPNSEQVIQKLIRSLRQAKREKYEADDSDRQAQNQACFSKKSQVDINEFSSLPKGLVGPASTVKVKLNGLECTALLDTGSQVTIVFDIWFSKNLPNVQVHPLTGLSIWGLSSSSYPYKGYIVVDVTFPAAVTGAEESISILALIFPDPEGPPQVPVIIGTNASFFQRLAMLSQETEEVGVARVLRIQTQTPAKQLLKKGEAKGLTDKPEGQVRWRGPGACVVPPKRDAQFVCQLETAQPLGLEIFMLDTAEDGSLPAGLFIIPVVFPSSAVDGKTIQVLVHNETSKDITIPAGAVVAHVYPTDTLVGPSGDSYIHKVIDPTLFDFRESPIPEAWERRLQQKLSNCGDVFSTDKWEVGLAQGVEHHIRLTDDKPFHERSKCIALADIEDVRRHVKELLAAGIIKESRSPYASPIVIARKKSGTIRMCIDYRNLNARTIPDQYTTPRIDDALDCLAGSKWFSVLDLRSGYYQIAMAEEDKEKTAFICPLGFYQFEWMQQGITGAPATFQRLMEKAVGDMHLLQVIVYLDDDIMFGRTLEEHEERLCSSLINSQNYIPAEEERGEVDGGYQGKPLI
uniref:uncharacterized protein LOC109952966 isoform X2 n=1 Tax=Monopterus albus TaxID=43700 RepID=UPI0009B42E58|nr:uncharacterized protein LOC109952966 isoform X2 [Monopterus albus]